MPYGLVLHELKGDHIQMSKLRLPDVTLVAIETREHELQRLAIEECLDKAIFGEVLILTDRPLEFASLSHHCDFRTHAVPDWEDKLGWCRASWYEVPPLLRTPFALQIQWDSWIWDTRKWTDEFFNYDFVGAPWWYKDGKNVGNSGFSLISTRLKRYLRDRQWLYPLDVTTEDDLMCRKFRIALEHAGFTWAPESLAHQFAFECSRPSPTSRHFGFHGAFNFGEVLTPERLEHRARIMLASPYIGNPDSYIFKAFAQNNKELVERILREELKSVGA